MFQLSRRRWRKDDLPICPGGDIRGGERKVQSDYGWPTLVLFALAGVSIAADWRRHRRRDADRAQARTGWVPWPLVTILALIAAAFCAALWLRGE